MDDFVSDKMVEAAVDAYRLHDGEDYAAMRAALVAAMGAAWRPIDECNKSITHLGIVDGDVRVIAWGKTSHVPIYGWCLADQGVEDFDLCSPSAVMPLLPPPAKEGV